MVYMIGFKMMEKFIHLHKNNGLSKLHSQTIFPTYIYIYEI